MLSTALNLNGNDHWIRNGKPKLHVHRCRTTGSVCKSVLSKQSGTVYSPLTHHSKCMVNMSTAICKRHPDGDKVPPSNELSYASNQLGRLFTGLDGVLYELTQPCLPASTLVHLYF